MWEAIRANTRRSRLLIGTMGAILVGLGYLVGVVYGGPEAGTWGAGGALAVWLALLIAALGAGEQVMMLGARARRVQKEDVPRLWNVVEEMTIASGLGTPPKIYLIDDDVPNAFAAGRTPESSCVAVTSGLLKRLTRDELQGVIAHELGHVRNHDVRFMTIAGVMLGSVVIISDVFLRSLWYGGGRRSGGGRGGGQGQAVFVAAAIVVAILAPVFTRLLYYACSRGREYLADASAARFTRYPPGLAGALAKISGGVGSRKNVPRALAPMYIVNPLQGVDSWQLFSTHPPTDKRIAILRSMGGNAGWRDYEAAYQDVVGGKACLDTRTRFSEESVAARAPHVEPEARADAVGRAREVVDLLDRMAGFVAIACPCGVHIKAPPGLRAPAIRCTRCGREHDIPRAEPADALPDSEGPLRYTRKSEGWESFQCSCGHSLQLSPAFQGSQLECQGCKRWVAIVSAQS